MTAVLGPDDIGRSLRRIAHEIVEQAGDDEDIVLLGILRRGTTLAHRLDDALHDVGLEVRVGALDTAPYRDDLDGVPEPGADRTDVAFDIEGRTVILVDDVLSTGRTIRAALDALVAIGRPARVRVAVLIDRGHRELPIRADHVGKNLPTSRDQRVAVRLAEIDVTEGVFIESAAHTASGGAQ